MANDIILSTQLELASAGNQVVVSDATGALYFFTAPSVAGSVLSYNGTNLEWRAEQEYVLTANCVPFDTDCVTSAAGILGDPPHGTIGGGVIKTYYRSIQIPDHLAGKTLNSYSVGSYISNGDSLVFAAYIASAGTNTMTSLSGSASTPSVAERITLTGATGYQADTLDTTALALTVSAGDQIFLALGTTLSTTGNGSTGINFGVTLS